MIKAVARCASGAQTISSLLSRTSVLGVESGHRYQGPQRTRLINGVAATSRYHPRSSGLMRTRVVST